jgi:hypothetical protein
MNILFSIRDDLLTPTMQQIIQHNQRFINMPPVLSGIVETFIEHIHYFGEFAIVICASGYFLEVVAGRAGWVVGSCFTHFYLDFRVPPYNVFAGIRESIIYTPRIVLRPTSVILFVCY